MNVGVSMSIGTMDAGEAHKESVTTLRLRIVKCLRHSHDCMVAEGVCLVDMNVFNMSVDMARNTWKVMKHLRLD